MRGIIGIIARDTVASAGAVTMPASLSVSGASSAVTFAAGASGARRVGLKSGRASTVFDLLLYWCRVSPRSTSARGWRRNLASERRLLDVSCEFGDEQPAKGSTSRKQEQRGNGPNHLPRSRDQQQ
jgi:hypothetical protein